MKREAEHKYYKCSLCGGRDKTVYKLIASDEYVHRKCFESRQAARMDSRCTCGNPHHDMHRPGDGY